MNLRFFADQCISKTIIKILREAGHEVLILSEHMNPKSLDVDVIKKAQEYNSILLSENGDFMNIIEYPPEQYKGIIGIQLNNNPTIIPDLVQNLIKYLSKYPDMSHYLGKLFIIEVHRIRIFDPKDNY